MLHNKGSRCNGKARHHNQRVRPLTATRAHLCSSKDLVWPPPKKRACERTAEAHAVLCVPVQWPEQWALQASLQGNCGVGSELACPPVH